MKHYSIGALFSISLMVIAQAGGLGGFWGVAFFAGTSFLGIAFGLLLTAWRKEGWQSTLRRLIREIYFPALRWSVFFIVFYNVFAWLGVTPDYWGWNRTAQNLCDAVFMISAEDTVLSHGIGALRALAFGTIISMATERAIIGTHPQAHTRHLRIAAVLVLGAMFLLTKSSGVELRGIAQGLGSACFISLGALLSEFMPADYAATTEAERDEASRWWRRAIVVQAFYPLVFALLTWTGMFPEGANVFVFALCGIGVPLLWLEGYRWLEARYGFTLSYRHLFRYETLKRGGRNAWRGLCIAAKATLRGTKKALAASYRALCAATLAVGRGLKGFVQGIKDVISASNPEDE